MSVFEIKKLKRKQKVVYVMVLMFAGTDEAKCCEANANVRKV